MTLMSVALGLIGCGPVDDEPRPPIVWQGDHVIVGAHEGTVICEGTFESLDRNVELLQNVFGYGPSNESIRVHVLDGEVFSGEAPCRDLVDACAEDNEIWTSYLPASHELVHAVRSQSIGWSAVAANPTVLEEGLAEVFGDRGPTAEPADLVDILDSQVFDAGDYVRAGHFARWLIDRYGLPQFLQLVDEARRADLDSGIRSVLETTRDALVSSYEEQVWCSRDQWRMPVLECSSEPLPWSDSSGQANISVDLELDCAAGAIGPRLGRRYVHRTIEIIEPGTYWLEVEHDASRPEDAFSLELLPCSNMCGMGVDIELTNTFLGSYAELELNPGTYFLELSGSVNQIESERVRARLERR